MKRHHIMLTLAAAASWLLTSSLQATCLAVADDTIVYMPDFSTFDAYQAESIPPVYEDVTGSELWNVTDTTSGITTPDALSGNDTIITFLSLSDNDFIIRGGVQDGLPPGTEINYLDLGGGFANEWVSSPANLPGVVDPSISDLFITPFGDFAIPVG